MRFGLDVSIVPAAEGEDSRLILYADVRNDVTTDFFTLDAEVSDDLLVAYGAAKAEIGFGVWIDYGGGFEEVPPAWLGPGLSINESLAGFADAADFSLLGWQWNPLHAALLRAKRPVLIYGYFGVSGRVVPVRLFSGFVDSGTWNADPPGASVHLLDSASSASEKLVTLNIDAGQGLTRGHWVRTILADAGVTDYDLNLPADGGIVTKGHSFGGQRLWDAVNDFLSPTGARVAVIDGRPRITRWLPAGVPHRTIGENDLRPGLSIAPPPTGTPNVIVVSGSLYDHTANDDDGNEQGGPSEILHIGWMSYAPATEKQLATGEIEAVTPGPEYYPVTIRRIVSDSQPPETITDGPFAGAIRTITTMDTFEWRAARSWVMGMQTDSDGYVTGFVYNVVYLHPDGRWSESASVSGPVLVRSEQEVRLVYPDEHRTVTTQTRREFYQRKTYVGTMHADGRIRYRGHGGATLNPGTYSAFPLNDKGEGLYPPAEGDEAFQVVERTVETVQADADDLVTYEERKVERMYARRTAIRPDALMFGPIGNETARRDSYEALRPYSLERTDYITLPDGRVRTVVTYSSDDEGERPAEITTRAGGRPSLNLSGSSAPLGRSTPSTVMLRNEYLIAANGEIEEHLSNEFAETDSELRMVALERGRELWAFRANIPTHFDVTIHKGTTIDFDVHAVRIEDGRTFDMRGTRWLVNEVSRTLSNEDGSNEQMIQAAYYPPDVPEV
jgi:hypothetical protein